MQRMGDQVRYATEKLAVVLASSILFLIKKKINLLNNDWCLMLLIILQIISAVRLLWRQKNG